MLEFTQSTPAAPAGRAIAPLLRLALVALTLGGVTACASGPDPASSPAGPYSPDPLPFDAAGAQPPSPDLRVGLDAGLMDAQEAIWNLTKLSTTPPPEDFIGVTNSDLAFAGSYAFQGNYNGFLVWDLSNPEAPELVTEYLCPASQSDVSVYGDLLFVSGEGFGGRVDCGTQGVDEAVSPDRLRGIRIFDISEIRNPEYIADVQTCRGSHTHTVLDHPGDAENVYIYVSGSAPIRPDEELEGCATGTPDEDPSTALFRIEVIQVPLANPQAAAIVSSPRIFDDLVAPPSHGAAPADLRAVEEARERGAFVVEIEGEPTVLPDNFVASLLADVVEARGGSGAPTAADSLQLREALPMIIDQMLEAQGAGEEEGPFSGPTQCHDITVYPEQGIAGGACEGYGLLLDITDPVSPVRVDAVSDENFAYWHSATFNNDASMVLFTDEWGGGGQPKCRVDDPEEWGANAIFSIENGAMRFREYWKLPAPQTPEENCVAHNGSIIPVPGRDIMVQAWYQGGITVFDWTDPENVVELAYHDRGPVNPEQMESGGSWSAYWYNGLIVSSEIARGLDIFELAPSPLITRNEIDAARTAQLDYLNPQGQPHFSWPPSFAKARALMDQLERSGGIDASELQSFGEELAEAESAAGNARTTALTGLAGRISAAAGGSSDAERVRMLAEAVEELAGEE